ncbi:MAG: DUF4418 family protein [Methanoregulaceae archaeon]|nr:DUF4418 family protein [Methanoregulaceae archaeon]
MVSETGYKGIGGLLIILGVLLALMSWYIFPVCEVQGSFVETKAGMKLPMTCGYSARAENGIGALVALTGIVLFFRSTRETRQILGVIDVALGLFAILTPTVIIGMCRLADHPCRTTTLPGLELLGAIIVIVGLFLFFVKDQVAAAGTT